MMQRLAIPEELDGARADRVVAVLCGVSRRIARMSIDDGGVTRRGTAVSASDRMRTGDVIDVDLIVEEDTVAPDVTVEFSVAFEDGDVVVIDKPAGVVVHPGAGRPSGTLANGLIARYPEIAEMGTAYRWGIVHRIDRDTSGLLIVAKTPTAFERLQAALKERAVTRSYLALVSGRFDNATGTIDAPVGRDPAYPTRMTVTETGRSARTHYRRAADWEEYDVSLMAVKLETGRTHQIRVHMKAIEHPVVGDPVYGPGRAIQGDPGRTWLHARSLTFEHPSGTGPLTVHSELPEDLTASLERIGPPDRGSVP
jgi:23S rRNA pseudouridine1911/1915/1917 synthase